MHAAEFAWIWKRWWFHTRVVANSESVRLFRSLLLSKIDTRLPGLAVLRLRLHRHLDEVDTVKSHRHSFAQLLCYLSAGGALKTGSTSREVEPGTLAWIPSGRIHSFDEHPRRRPLCLAIDLRLRPQPPLAFARLNHSETIRIRQLLTDLGALKNPSGIESRFLTSSVSLAILDIQFRALGFLPRPSIPSPAIVRKFEALAADAAHQHESVEELCRQLHRSPDHLNRLFKKHTGLTLRQCRDSAKLLRCQELLRSGLPVGRVAEECGFHDANYFARWFRTQTGIAPSRFSGRSI